MRDVCITILTTFLIVGHGVLNAQSTGGASSQQNAASLKQARDLLVATKQILNDESHRDSKAYHWTRCSNRNWLPDLSGEIDKINPNLQVVATGTLASTVEQPRLLSLKSGLKWSAGAKPRSGDIVKLTWSSGNYMAFVYTGEETFPNQQTPNSFFLYPYRDGLTHNSIPPRKFKDYYYASWSSADWIDWIRLTIVYSFLDPDALHGNAMWQTRGYWTKDDQMFATRGAWTKKPRVTVFRFKDTASLAIATPQKPEVKWNEANHQRWKSSEANTTREINEIVLHVTENREGKKQVATWANSSGKNTCAHYLVDRDGTIYQCVKDNDIAHHCSGHNLHSIGIEHSGLVNYEPEIDNPTSKGYSKLLQADKLTPKQEKSSVQLIRWLMYEYDIPKPRVIGHRHMNENISKSCPGFLFGGEGTAVSDGPTPKVDDLGHGRYYPHLTSSWQDERKWIEKHLSNVPNQP